jgi:hypothetical protein
MVTDAALANTISSSHSNTRFLSRAADHVNQFFCGLGGHDSGLLLHVEDGHMSLHCVSCGYETPGWDLKPPRRTA